MYQKAWSDFSAFRTRRATVRGMRPDSEESTWKPSNIEPSATAFATNKQKSGIKSYITSSYMGFIVVVLIPIIGNVLGRVLCGCDLELESLTPSVCPPLTINFSLQRSQSVQPTFPGVFRTRITQGTKLSEVMLSTTSKNVVHICWSIYVNYVSFQ